MSIDTNQFHPVIENIELSAKISELFCEDGRLMGIGFWRTASRAYVGYSMHMYAQEIVYEIAKGGPRYSITIQSHLFCFRTNGR